MPTYEYACRSCGEHFEVVQSFRDDPLTECPGCQGELRKVFSPIGITFKGSGFYKTDSRSSSSKGSSGESSASESKSGESKSGESKSAESKSGESKSGESKSGDSKPGGSSEKTAAAS